jgi:hypothetical protein
MWELAAIGLVIAAVALWMDSLHAREAAVAAGRLTCERYGVQLLDDTVAITRLRVARDENGRLRLRRTYVFEFSGSGNDRYQGAVVLLGARVEDLQLEPYRMH